MRTGRLVEWFGQTSSDSTAPTQWAFPFLCSYLLGLRFGGCIKHLLCAHTELGSPPGCQELGESQSPCPQRVHPPRNSTQPSTTRLPARFFLATAAILGLYCLVPVAYFDPEGSAWCLGKDLEVLCQLVRDQGWKNTNLAPRDLIFFDFIEAFGQEKPKSQHGPKAGVRGCSHVPPHHKNLARPQGAGLLPAPWLCRGFGLHQLLILLPTSALFLQ